MTNLERVRIAANVLDKVFPGWLDRLNTENCDIRSPRDCVLVRASGLLYHEALEMMYDGGYPPGTQAFCQVVSIQDWDTVIAERKAAM